MRAKPTLLAAVVLIAFVVPSALALTVPVSQDTSSGKTGLLTSKSGEATSLTVSDDQTALLKFDLSKLDVVPAAIDPANIKSAILELYVIKSNTAADLSVLTITGTWSETFIPPTEHLPSIDSTNVLATIPVPKMPDKQFVSVDITPAVVAALQSGSNLSIAIETSTHDAILSLGSKDGPALGYAATIEIDAAFPSTSGASSPFTIGTVTSGTAPGVALGGSSTDQILNFTLVPGVQGNPGPADSITIGTVTSGTALAVTITGTSPNQLLNIVIPNGQLSNGDTGIGYNVLPLDTGGNNTAFGYDALPANQSGYYNAAFGEGALGANVGGYHNVATGAFALTSNVNAYGNTAVGFNALQYNDGSGNEIAFDNTALGDSALKSNVDGALNTALGASALKNNSGSLNIAMGYQAGVNLTTGSNNIDIGNPGVTGESSIIRIGDGSTQTDTYLTGEIHGNGAGLTGVNIPASAITGTLPASQVAAPPPGMVLIPGGTFAMGNVVGSGSDPDITDAAPVTVTVLPFYMDANLVTLGQWQSVYFWAKSNGYTDIDAGAGDAGHNPVYNVNWYDCVKWCNARSEQARFTPVYYTDSSMTTVYRTGNLDNAYMNIAATGYRLPTEAEWEKAARGGIAGQRFPWGNLINGNLANYFGNTSFYNYDLGPNGFNPLETTGTDNGITTPVGTFPANVYGLYDMAGNVFEWCWDWYGTPYGQPGTINPIGPPSGSERVTRAGSVNDASLARCAARNNAPPGDITSAVGFRTVMSPAQPSP
jgi:formylglycine-generating enzyme required for sulfatase activity